MGGEPIVTAGGEPLTDARGRNAYATSAGAGPSVGTHIVLAYLPTNKAIEGATYAVEYMSELLPATVAVVGARPLFDPDNERHRG